MRHEGVLESQIFYLLGTKPVWNDRGKVVDVEVIPTRAAQAAARRHRHRVRGRRACSTTSRVLMDKAVQKVKAIDEAENFVRRHYLQTKAALIEKGYSRGGRRSRAPACASSTSRRASST